MATAYAQLQARLERAPVLLDAPVGPELVRRGVRWRKHGLQTDGDEVRRAHVDFLRAGADLLRTNTFGLNHRTYLNVFRSPEHMRQIGAPGLDLLAPQLLRRAVELARAAREEAQRPEVPIAGVTSTLEHVFRPDLVPDVSRAEAEHAELAATLADAGADLIFVEAMTTLAETRAALAAARSTELPVWISFAVDQGGNLLGGESLSDAASHAAKEGVQAVVVTGGLPEDVLAGLRRLAGLGTPLGAAPMCGRFNPPSWKFEFHPQFADAPEPTAFAAGARGWIDAGARVIGAWCGATPEHVAALRGVATDRSGVH